MEDINFADETQGGSYGQETPVTITESDGKAPPPVSAYPPPIVDLPEAKMTELTSWLTQQLHSLISSQAPKLDEWRELETAYTAKSLGPQTQPFVGASGDVVPLIAMAVDPIHARLDTGIFGNSPMMQFKPLKKDFVESAPAVEKFFQYYQKHVMKFPLAASPRLLEDAKLGTMVFKCIYDCDEYSVRTYDSNWKVIDKVVTRYKGPRIVGVPLDAFYFPPHNQNVQQCSIVAERLRMSYAQLRAAEASKKLTNCDKIKHLEFTGRTTFEEEQAASANHRTTMREEDLYEVYECWFDYVVDDAKGVPARMCAIFHLESCTFLQLRYNWYFHQRKPYVVIPYSIRNNSMYGYGIAEMIKPFQDMLTRWERAASDNAYLANIRMWATRKGSGLDEASLKTYAGRNIPMEDPSKDIQPLQLGDTYNSTIQERQNLIGLSEKRTGVSDYLTGRESSVVGSRATATSTMALIQEGTKRVEKVLDNIRVGFAELTEMCLAIWIQYGLDDIDDVVFGDDETAVLVRDFFDKVSAENVNGALAIDLAATDASNNKSIQQQMQLAVIQTMMQYIDRLLQMGGQAIQMAQSGQVEMAAFLTEVASSARKMFKDMLEKYDIPNVEEYLPELEDFVNVAHANGVAGAAAGINGQDPTGGGVPMAQGGGGFTPPPVQQQNAGQPRFPGNVPSFGGNQGV